MLSEEYSTEPHRYKTVVFHSYFIVKCQQGNSTDYLSLKVSVQLFGTEVHVSVWLWIAPPAAQAHRAEHDTRQSHPNQITVKMQESSWRWRSMGDKSLTPKLFLLQPDLFKISPTFPIKNKQTNKKDIHSPPFDPLALFFPSYKSLPRQRFAVHW